MDPITVHTGTAAPLRRDCVDTDQILPAEFCKRLTKTGYQDALFAGWRADPAFVLNQPAYAGASILLAGRDFGIGSSREHAVWALRDGGFRVVVAGGFGDIFRRNAANNGLLLIDQPRAVVAELLDLVEREPGTAVTGDLEARELRFADRVEPFSIDEKSRGRLLAGLDGTEATLLKRDRIAAFEASRPYWLPIVRPAGAESGASRP